MYPGVHQAVGVDSIGHWDEAQRVNWFAIPPYGFLEML